VVGVPGQNVARTKPHKESDAPDLNHTSLPDVVGVSLVQLLERVEALETRLNGHAVEKPHVHAPHDEAWSGGDFAI
jgi:serine O-acetyltransferase